MPQFEEYIIKLDQKFDKVQEFYKNRTDKFINKKQIEIEKLKSKKQEQINVIQLDIGVLNEIGNQLKNDTNNLGLELKKTNDINKIRDQEILKCDEDIEKLKKFIDSKNKYIGHSTKKLSSSKENLSNLRKNEKDFKKEFSFYKIVLLKKKTLRKYLIITFCILLMIFIINLMKMQ